MYASDIVLYILFLRYAFQLLCRCVKLDRLAVQPRSVEVSNAEHVPRISPVNVIARIFGDRCMPFVMAWLKIRGKSGIQRKLLMRTTVLPANSL